MAPVAGLALACWPQHRWQPRPPQSRQRIARPGSWPLLQLLPGSLQDWQFSGAWAQLPPVHAKGRLPCWVMQPVSPAKTTTTNAEKIARFMSEDSLFCILLVSCRAGEVGTLREPRLCHLQTSARHPLESRKSAEPLFSAGLAPGGPTDRKVCGADLARCVKFAGEVGLSLPKVRHSSSGTAPLHLPHIPHYAVTHPMPQYASMPYFPSALGQNG